VGDGKFWVGWCQPTGLVQVAPHYSELTTTHTVPYLNPVLGFPSFFMNSWPLKTGPIGSPETSVSNYHYSLRNTPEEPVLIYCAVEAWNHGLCRYLRSVRVLATCYEQDQMMKAVEDKLDILLRCPSLPDSHQITSHQHHHHERCGVMAVSSVLCNSFTSSWSCPVHLLLGGPISLFTAMLVSVNGCFLSTCWSHFYW